MPCLFATFTACKGRLWRRYGFYDAFNLDQNWFAGSYLAIDQGPIVAMIENQRTGLLWQFFMQNPEIAPALQAIGFQADNSPAEVAFLQKNGFDGRYSPIRYRRRKVC